MKKYLVLTRVLLKSGLGDFSNKKGKKRKFSLSKISTKLLYVFIIICFLPLMFSLFMAGKEGYILLNSMGQGGIVINLITSLGAMMTFVFGLMVVITVYYYTSDIEYLLPLPIKPTQIISAKFTVTLFYEYLSILILFVPPMIGYGVASNSGVLYWSTLVIAMILLPIVPLIYASVISMLIMLVFKKAKNRDFLTIISSIITIIIILGINGYSNSMASMSSEALGELLVKGNNSLVGTINVIFPNLILLQKAFVFQQPLYLIYYIISIIVFMVVFVFIAKILYFKGVVGMSQTSSKRKVLSEKESNKIIKRNSAVKVYIAKELKLLVRTPIYFLNCVLISIIWPLLFVIPFVGSFISSGNSEDSTTGILAMLESFSFSDTFIIGLCILFVFCISIFVTSINFSAGTSLSREGKNFFVIKYIPLSYKKQIFAKVMSGVIISLVSTTLYCLIAMIVLRLPLFAIVISTIVSLISSFLFNYLAILVDLIRPKLNWENEQSAVKQNLNTFVEMFISIVIGGAIAYLGIIAFTKFEVSIYVIGIVACIFLLILVLLLHKLVLSFGAKRIKAIE